MPGAVDVGVVAFVGGVLDVGDVDGDAAFFLFRRFVDLVEFGLFRVACLRQNVRDRRRQRRLAVVDVPDRSDVQMGLAALKFLFCHCFFLPRLS